MIEPALQAADFDEFFAAVYPNKTPFPWQRRLAAQVCAKGEWPGLLDLPTGTGKTAVLDIAVFAMAVDAGRLPEARCMPRRAILVVDRRTVVDQAHVRARTLADLLHHPDAGSILRRVADALHSLRGQVALPPGTKHAPARPLEVAYLRGAIPRDDGWARDPSQPMLGVSTVDQVGSRLLFRGYGVSPGMRSVHAGLLGNDVVYFLDEVHLSQPFAETLRAVGRWRTRAETRLPPALQVVEMSATHRSEEAAFALAEDDRAHPVLRRRLEAKKPATLEVVKVAGDEDRRRTTVAQRLADLALGARTERHRRIAVVVNRVNTALAVHDAIAVKLRDPDRVVLVTGRMRPLDREDREHDLRLVQAGVARDTADSEPATFVVATQCIEAGADLDFDVLITECASLDAVVQRFGRLDRLGDHGDARGVIAIRSDHTGKDDDDPVYGAARTATWNHLSAHALPLDFGLQGGVRNRAPDSVLPPERHSPVLLPSHLDLWSQTRPGPFPDPDIALWLHGPEQGSPEVNIVWRADLVVGDGSFARLDHDTLESLFESSPPLRQEALAVPLWAAEAWLRGGRVEGVADVEGGVGPAANDRDGEPAAPRWAIRWRGGDGVEIVDGRGQDDADQLRAGDTIVVPTSYGGIRAGTWAADSLEPVADRGDEAQLRQRHRLVVRLDALALPSPDGEVSAAQPLSKLADRLVKASGDTADEDPAEVIEQIREHLRLATGVPPWLAKVVGGAGKLQPLFIEPEFGRVHVLLDAVNKIAPAPRHDAELGVVKERVDDDLVPDVSSEDDRASRTGVEVSLVDHLTHVSDYARAFASTRGLPLGVATDVVLAAAWHDAGKADSRFQLWLAGGDEVAYAARSEPLAKSARKEGDRRRQREARTRARYPRGARHELASVAMLERCEAVLAQATDRDLVLHLIASHHGWCRPFAPVEDAGDTVAIEWQHEGIQLSASSDHGLAHVGASVVDRFWAMTQKYGWWGLAWLETLVRLADHRASQAEQDQASSGGSR